MYLTTTQSTLLHSALAVVSPPLREFDLLAFANLHRITPSRPVSLSSMPSEILLHIRSLLLPMLISHFISVSASSLQRYEAALRYLMCPHCAFYNQYVYGLDVWKWHPCSCAPACPNPKQFRDRHHWLESYLSRKSLWFRGLSPQTPSSSTAIWDIVTEVLKDFECEAIWKGSGGLGAARLPLLSRQDSRPIVVVPRICESVNSAKEHSVGVSLRQLERDLGLSWDYSEPCQRPPDLVVALDHPAPDLAAPSNHPEIDIVTAGSTVISFLETAKISGVVIAIFEATMTLLTSVFSVFTSFFMLFFTVLCYYSRPGALRLL
ncbi:hypothetical protein GGX14DRAFT_371446 [Mycena pura]|uniref:Uncharacterized protein n=1 Tax=Mycena pura TaxID=153505 RepID=A0AAD6V367_9AGAR|nr:hypothetical protein GGX14DRAFT_371446 [Mycena pura]